MSAIPKMTVRQIANTAKCHPDTVRDTARRLFPELVQNGKRTEFDERQAFEIMSALPKRNIVGGQPSEKPEGRLLENPKVLPTGTQLHELRMIYGPQGAAARLDHLIGYKPGSTALPGLAALAIEAPKPSRSSILTVQFPTRDRVRLSLILKMSVERLEAMSRKLDIHIGEWDLEDAYRLLCAREGVEARALREHVLSARERVMREHIIQIERDS